MTTIELAREIVATYESHGWELRRVLLSPEARAEIAAHAKDIFADATIHDSNVNALWFARASHAQRESWELRLISAQSYALFEAFEANEAEEDREDVRREMENRMRDYANAG